MTELDAALSQRLAPGDHSRAQALQANLMAIADAERRLDRFQAEWIRSGPSDAALARQAFADTVAALLAGDLKKAERAAAVAAVKPTVLGRSDFPAWYSGAQYQADKGSLQNLPSVKGQVWDLTRRLAHQRAGSRR